MAKMGQKPRVRKTKFQISLVLLDSCHQLKSKVERGRKDHKGKKLLSKLFTSVLGFLFLPRLLTIAVPFSLEMDIFNMISITGTSSEGC